MQVGLWAWISILNLSWDLKHDTVDLWFGERGELAPLAGADLSVAACLFDRLQEEWGSAQFDAV